jgi:hypothetical protein
MPIVAMLIVTSIMPSVVMLFSWYVVSRSPYDECLYSICHGAILAFILTISVLSGFERSEQLGGHSCMYCIGGDISLKITNVA